MFDFLKKVFYIICMVLFGISTIVMTVYAIGEAIKAFKGQEYELFNLIIYPVASLILAGITYFAWYKYQDI